MEFLILIIFGPALLLPAIVGLYLIFRPSRIRKFIGWFSFKPVLATPLFLWIFISVGSRNPLAKYYSLLPGLVLTILILLRFRDLYKSQTARIAVSLLVLDLIRWGSAVLSVIFDDYTYCFGRNCPQSTWGPLLFLFTLAFPTVCAIIAGIINAGIPEQGTHVNTAPVA